MMEFKLPVVATVETARDKGLPVRPMNLGGAILADCSFADATQVFQLNAEKI